MSSEGKGGKRPPPEDSLPDIDQHSGGALGVLAEQIERFEKLTEAPANHPAKRASKVPLSGRC